MTKEGTDYRSYLEQGKAMLEVFAVQVPVENCNVLAVEEPFSIDLEGLPVPLIGVYDLVIEDSSGVITIVDHKTSAKSYSVDQVDQNFQVTIYQAAAKANGFAEDELVPVEEISFDNLETVVIGLLPAFQCRIPRWGSPVCPSKPSSCAWCV